MSETEFEHVYEMTKRTACVRFGVEAFTVGYQDAHAGRAPENGFESEKNREYYEQGYAACVRLRDMKRMAALLTPEGK